MVDCANKVKLVHITVKKLHSKILGVTWNKLAQ